MASHLEKVVSLCKRRGFVFPGSEIYGGLANTWDFGPLGTLLKNNIRDFWWERFVTMRDDIVGVDASVFLNPTAWQASGHVAGFTDSLIDCKSCRSRTRADHLIEDYFSEKGEKKKVEGLTLEELNKIIGQNKDILCPKCGKYDWTTIRKFNLLFETQLGIIEGEKSKVYLRGEIAQGIFLNFKNVLDSTRIKIPFGIAQQGKAFRNEITMGQFLHRTLEFDLMEFEYFINPLVWENTYAYWQLQMWDWAKELGLSEEHLRWREHEEFERSHYSKRTMDIEYHYDFGWKEMFGLAYRTDFDLSNHTKHANVDLSYLDLETNKKYTPHVIEPTFGLSRLVGIVLYEAYYEDGERVVLKLPPRLAPYKVAVFPLVKNKPEFVDKARNIYNHLKNDLKMSTTWDDRGNIGKRYYSQDEAGTPWCVTVDYQTLEDDSVTIRDRDTALQERVKADMLEAYFNGKLKM